MTSEAMTPAGARLNLPGAVMPVSSIIGTGNFVSLGIGISMAGPWCAGHARRFVAMCNGLNSAQLAANHPVSGGTYEYGHVGCDLRGSLPADVSAPTASAATRAAALYLAPDHQIPVALERGASPDHPHRHATQEHRERLIGVLHWPVAFVALAPRPSAHIRTAGKPRRSQVNLVNSCPPPL